MPLTGHWLPSDCSSRILRAAIKASCGMLPFPYSRIRALPFFCFLTTPYSNRFPILTLGSTA